MITFSFPSNGQSIKGRIIDANDGKPLAGAIVRTTADDGSTIQYSMSDSEGIFTIIAGADAKALKVAFLGYKEQQFSFPFNKHYEISLEREAEKIKEASPPQTENGSQERMLPGWKKLPRGVFHPRGR